MGAAVVVGAGVVGLSCAVRLAEAGHRVRVLTREPPGRTTSAVAGAVWLPYRVGPVERVGPWAAATRDALVHIAEAEPASGVRVREGVLLHRVPVPEPDWAPLVPGLALRPVADPAPGYGFGFAMTAPVVDMNRYLPHLQRRLEAAGGTLEQADVRDLGQVGRAGGAAVVVDAAGLGARQLAGDAALRAVRGQTVLLRNPGLTRWLCDEDEEEPGAGGEAELSYVLPRLDDVVVGGTAGEDDEHAAPRPATAERILARAVALVPELAGAQVLEHRVGLRPARPRVRLEVERAPGGPVVHCYGHGGAGVTLSWGCADDVLAAVAALV